MVFSHPKVALALVAIVAVFVAFVPNVWAQNNSVDYRIAVNDNTAMMNYSSITYARNFGPLMAEICRIRAPYYKEAMVGIGFKVVNVKDVAFYALAHWSKATDDNYFEPGVFAIDATGKVTSSFWGVYYRPMGSKGVGQIVIDPIEVQYNVWGPLLLGVSGYFWKPENGEWMRKIGPKVTVGDNLGATEVRVAKVSGGGGTEIQLRRLFVF